VVKIDGENPCGAPACCGRCFCSKNPASVRQAGVTQDSSVTNDQQRIQTLMSVIQKVFYFEKNQNQLMFEK
jgi:hypothetical protein